MEQQYVQFVQLEHIRHLQHYQFVVVALPVLWRVQGRSAAYSQYVSPRYLAPRRIEICRVVVWLGSVVFLVGPVEPLSGRLPRLVCLAIGGVMWNTV